jgi:hypothetical protein
LAADLAITGHTTHRLNEVKSVVEAEGASGEKCRIPTHTVATNADDIEFVSVEAEKIKCGTREGKTGGILTAEQLRTKGVRTVHVTDRWITPIDSKVVEAINCRVKFSKYTRWGCSG